MRSRCQNRGRPDPIDVRPFIHIGGIGPVDAARCLFTLPHGFEDVDRDHLIADAH